MPQIDLTAVVEDRGTTRTISLHGEMDVATAASVDDVLLDALDDADVETVVVDLERLSFIDSTGVAVLLGLHARSERAGTRLVLLPAPPSVQRVLAACGVLERLPFAALSAHPQLLVGPGGAVRIRSRGWAGAIRSERR